MMAAAPLAAMAYYLLYKSVSSHAARGFSLLRQVSPAMVYEEMSMSDSNKLWLALCALVLSIAISPLQAHAVSCTDKGGSCYTDRQGFRFYKICPPVLASAQMTSEEFALNMAIQDSIVEEVSEEVGAPMSRVGELNLAAESGTDVGCTYCNCRFHQQICRDAGCI